MTKTPEILWAQRSDRLFLTFEVWEPKDVKFALTSENTVEFSCSNGETKENFATTLTLWGPVETEPEARDVKVSARHVEVTLHKKEEKTDSMEQQDSTGFWPRLQQPKGKWPHIKIDFGKWREPDEASEGEADLMGGGGDMGMGGGMGGMDLQALMSQMQAGGMGGGMPGGSNMADLGFGEDDDPEQWGDLNAAGDADKDSDDEAGHQEEEPLDRQLRELQQGEQQSAATN